MGGGSAPKVSPPPIAAPSAVPVSDDENAKAAAEAIARRERLAKGRRSTLLSGMNDVPGLGTMDTQRKSLLG
jgi:hypothetical protein